MFEQVKAEKEVFGNGENLLVCGSVMKLPDEMGFIGFDNTAYAEMATPKLTTLGHPKEAFGSLAAEKLLRMIDGERERSVNMAWTLVERDSLPRVERL